MDPKSLKVYVLVRKDLPWAQRAVQACHAVARLTVRHSRDPSVIRWADENPTLILLGIDSQDELLQWEDLLRATGEVCESFAEPDLANEKTALAVHPAADPGCFGVFRCYDSSRRAGRTARAPAQQIWDSRWS